MRGERGRGSSASMGGVRPWTGGPWVADAEYPVLETRIGASPDSKSDFEDITHEKILNAQILPAA
jgi:hypothetical protein